MDLSIALQSESGEQLEFIADEKNLLDRAAGLSRSARVSDADLDRSLGGIRR